MGIAIVIGISMILSMVIARFYGAIITIGLKAIGQDPAKSSSIILTTVTDICGFFKFLSSSLCVVTCFGNSKMSRNERTPKEWRSDEDGY